MLSTAAYTAQLNTILGDDFTSQTAAIKTLRLMNLANHGDFLSHHLVSISELLSDLHDEGVTIPAFLKNIKCENLLLKSPFVRKKYSVDELEQFMTEVKYQTELNFIRRHKNVHSKIEKCGLFITPPPLNLSAQIEIAAHSKNAYVLVGHQLYYQSQAEWEDDIKKDRFVLVKEFNDEDQLNNFMSTLRILEIPSQTTQVYEQLSVSQLAQITTKTGHAQKVVYYYHNEATKSDVIAACIPLDAIDRFNQSVETERRKGFTPNIKVIAKEPQTIFFLENMAAYMKISPDEANSNPFVIELADLIGEDFFSLDTHSQLERLEQVFQVNSHLADVLFDLKSLIKCSFESWLIPEPKKMQKDIEEEMRDYYSEFFKTTTLCNALETKRELNLSTTTGSASSSSPNSPRSVLITEGLFSPLKSKPDREIRRSPRRVAFADS